MNLFLYVLTVLLWGTTWIALKFQVGDVAIPVSIAYRFGLAAAILFAALWLSRRLQPTTAYQQRLCLAQGLCLFCLNFLCFYTASQWITSGLIAVVFSTATLWNALNGRLWFGQAMAPNVMAGGALGLCGLGLLFAPELAQTPSLETLWGIGLCVLGTLCFSFGNMLSSLLQRSGLRPLTSNAWGMLYGTLALSLYALVSGTPFSIAWTPAYLGSLLYLAVPGSVIGFTAYLTLVGRMGADKAAYSTVLFPLVALNISAWVEGYVWTLPALAGLALVMLGNVLVFRKPARAPIEPASTA